MFAYTRKIFISLLLSSLLLGEDSRSELQKGFHYFLQQQYTKAYQVWEPLAKQGNVDAQNYLGAMYENHLGVTLNYQKAIYWYTKAAEQGNVISQKKLGQIFLYGLIVPKDYPKAFKWCTKASEQGNPDAQKNLAFMYEYGLNTPKDLTKAIYWYTQAAEQGNADAQTSLGVMYIQGKGVLQDSKKGILWYSKAADQGDSIAREGLGTIFSEGVSIPANRVIAYAIYALPPTIDAPTFDVSRTHKSLTLNMTKEEINSAKILSKKMQNIGIYKVLEQYLNDSLNTDNQDEQTLKPNNENTLKQQNMKNELQQGNTDAMVLAYGKNIQLQAMQTFRFPRNYRKEKQEGTAIISFIALASGGLRDITLTQSTGYDDLDEAILTSVKSIYTFPPLNQDTRFTVPFGFKQ